MRWSIWSRLILMGLSLVCAGPASAARAPVTLADLHRIVDLADPALSPDGRQVVFGATGHDMARDAQQSRLWLASLDGSVRRELSTGAETSDSHGVWTPDGTSVVYLSAAGDAPAQVWIRPVDGGAARQITHEPEGVSDFALSPDGRRLALVIDDPKPVTTPGRAEPPFVTERFQFKDDDAGFLDEHRHHLYLAGLDDGAPVLLTPGPHDEFLPSWSPDGALIAFVTRRGTDADRHANHAIWTVEARRGGAERQITTFPGPNDDPYWSSRPAWSPDGSRIAYLQGGEEKWIEYAPWQVTIVDLASRRTVQPAAIDRNMYGPKFSGDGKSVYARIEEAETVRLARIDLAGGRIEYLTPDRRYDADFDVAANGSLVVIGGDELAPYELSVVRRGLRPLGHLNDAWLASVQIQPDQVFTADSSDGTTIHGLLVLPQGYRKGRTVPTILRLHGGPVYQFSHEFMFDWQYFAAQGYAVVGVNPRGSSGRGFDFARAIYADWGHRDVEDVRAVTDHVIAAGIADPARLGVGGWSYGGILTDDVIASDARFKAAISGAGSGNMLGMYGADEYARDYELELGTPWRNFDAYVRVSTPFLHADRIRTPTLFLCAGDDMNVPCIGSEQMYQALRSQDVPTRLIRFPRQHHELTIPSYLEFRLQQYGAWYDRFLKPSGG